ncbi:DUF4407 domain-containing protein [Galbibacter sp. EGI 63066]|uniref:DUF4407 domain-containing protein n=1 Tax=Galbibacter sp. EGI 63066 TaxID=2993559 RepID=UPI00224962F0|nr:DUF4407 domain-containing protein [Galbibacter sp. EGI 63066]MCX2679864.1 DUF4407 domain-containing protein [Galbibacter sp. EGI 63066]
MLNSFFRMCSGADTELLEECSKAEQIKQAGIGATVFFTAVMAFIACSYALYTVFDNVLIAVFFGLVWGLLIFNLDRFIVSTIKKRDNFRSEFLQAVPRIILAIIIAVVIAKPLELKIFEKEIDRVLLEEKNQMTLDNQEQIALQYNPETTQLQTEIDALKAGISEKEAEVNNLYDTYIAEAEGREGTLKIGKGPVYKEKREKHDAALSELQALRLGNNSKIAEKESQIAALEMDYKGKVADTQPTIDGFDGLMARISALDELPWFPSFFIFLLFLAIETAPVISKLLAPKGEYDMKLEDAESTVKTWVDQKEYQRKQQLATDAQINDKVYEDLAGEEELYAYKQKMAREIMQLQADAFYKQQKRNL